MSIDISADEQLINAILPQAITLEGSVNTQGTYLVFDSIAVNEVHTGSIDTVFRLFIAISSRRSNKRLVYTPVTAALNALITDWDLNQKVKMGRITPFTVKGLIVYQVLLTVKGYTENDYVEPV